MLTMNAISIYCRKLITMKVCVNLIATLVLYLAATVADVEAPLATVVFKGTQDPYFVSAKSVLLENGTVNPDVFDSGGVEYLRSRLRTDKERRSAEAQAYRESSQSSSAEVQRCSSKFISGHHGARTRDWSEIVAKGRFGFRGKVERSTPGLTLLIQPETLLTIRVTESLTPEGESFVGRLVHALYPGADFTLAGTRFCAASPHGIDPLEGDELLIVADDEPRDVSGTFFVVQEDQVVFARSGRVVGRAGLPAIHEAQSLDQLVSTSKRLL
jgi:hypothetical protein